MSQEHGITTVTGEGTIIVVGLNLGCTAMTR